MVCKEAKTLYNRCGHIVTTIVHLRPCPLALAYQYDDNNNNNPQAQGQEVCGGNERYYRIIANTACLWCFIQDWSVPNFEQRVGGPEFLSQQVIENRRTVFEAQIATQAQLTLDERIDFDIAVTQDFIQTQRVVVIMHNQNRVNQALHSVLEGVRRERIINSVLRPVEGEPRDSHCSICGKITVRVRSTKKELTIQFFVAAAPTFLTNSGDHASWRGSKHP